MAKLRTTIKKATITILSLFVGFVVVTVLSGLSAYRLEKRLEQKNPDSLLPMKFLKKVSNNAIAGGGACSGSCGQCDM